MKKMINIKTYLWLFVTFFAVSCAMEDGAVYENPDGIVQASLASAKYDAVLAPVDGQEIAVPLQRNITKGAFDLSVNFTSSSALFTMVDTVIHFADGEGTAYAKIAFPGAEQLGAGVIYTVKISLEDDMLSVGGIKEQTLTLSRRLTWTKIGAGQWTDGIVAVIYGAPALTYDVQVEKAEEAEGVYRMVNPYGYGVYAYTAEKEVVVDPCYIIINAEDPTKVFIGESNLGIDWGDGQMYVVRRNNYYGSSDGSTITFPAGTLIGGIRGIGLVSYADICVLVLP